MNKTEREVFAKKCGYKKSDWYSLPEAWADAKGNIPRLGMAKSVKIILWLCGKGFDVFGLIKAKKAFDKKRAMQLIAEQKKAKPQNAKVPVRKLPARNRRHL